MENTATKPEANISGIAEQKGFKYYYQCAEIPKPWPDTTDAVYNRIIMELPFAKLTDKDYVAKKQ